MNRLFRFLGVCSFFVLMFSSSPVFSTENPSPGLGFEDYQQARTLVQEGSLEEAEDAFKRALVLEPMNPEYHFELANLYALQRDDSEKLGDSLGSDNRLDLAAGELEQAVNARPDFLPAHFNLGVVYKRLGEYENARKHFKEVLRLDAAQVSARMQIASTYEAQGFYDEAETLYREIYDEYPGNPEVRDAMEGVNERRFAAAQDENRQRGMRMNSMSSAFSGLGGGQSPYAQGLGANPYQQQPAGGGLGSAVPMLGQWALQQFSKGKDKTSNEY